MLQELFQAINEQAQAANSPNLSDVDLRKPFVYRMPNGELKVVPATRSPKRTHHAGSVDAICKFAAHHGLGAKASVWVNRYSVNLFPDDENREDAVTMKLGFSEPTVLLQTWLKNGPCMSYDQVAAIRMIRVEMRGCLQSENLVLGVLRNLRWAKSEGGEGKVEKGKSSLGKQFAAEIMGVDSLPDFVKFAVPVFGQGFESIQTVECALEPYEQTCKFSFIPTFGQIEKAIVAAELDLINTLSLNLPEGVPVYHGQP